MLLNSPYTHVTRKLWCNDYFNENHTWEPWEIPREVPQNIDLASALPYIIRC